MRKDQEVRDGVLERIEAQGRITIPEVHELYWVSRYTARNIVLEFVQSGILVDSGQFEIVAGKRRKIYIRNTETTAG